MKYAIYAFIVSAVVTIALGPVIIPMLRRLKFGQNERSDGPQSHLSKAGTPTMGGMMFIAGILVGTLAFSLNATELALPALLATAAFALVGFLDNSAVRNSVYTGAVCVSVPVHRIEDIPCLLQGGMGPWHILYTCHDVHNHRHGELGKPYRRT